MPHNALAPTQPRRGAVSAAKGSKAGQPAAACINAKQQVTATADGSSWNIKALFRQPRRLLRRPAAMLATTAAHPTEAAAAADQPSASRLQHAVSITPLAGGQQVQQAQQQDSLDSMLLGDRQWQRAASRSQQRGTAARSGSPSRAARAGCSAAGRCMPPDALDAAMDGAAPASRCRRTADPGAKLAAAQQEVQHLQGQLSQCEAQLAAVMQQVERAEAAAEGLPPAELQSQAHELEHDVKAMDCHFEAEVHRLAAAARAARRRTAALQTAAQEQAALEGGWQRRVELMQDTHQPLSQVEQEQRHHLEAQFWFRVVRFSTDAS